MPLVTSEELKAIVDTIPKTNPYGTCCPICGEFANSSCRCRVGNKSCKNGHTWVECPVDGHRIVPAYDTHKSGLFKSGECWCDLGEVYPAEGPSAVKIARRYFSQDC